MHMYQKKIIKMENSLGTIFDKIPCAIVQGILSKIPCTIAQGIFDMV